MSKSSVSKKVFHSFSHCISKLDRLKYLEDLVHDSNKDFSRNRKLSFPSLIQMIISMSGNPIREELLEYFNYDSNTATASAFIQARDKIKPKAFELLMNYLNEKYPCNKTYKGYRLLAVDGSDLSIPYDSDDIDTFVQQGDKKGYNLYHINAEYDILNYRYLDMILQGKASCYEQMALWTMADRFPEKKSIFIADRAYPCWNTMEHIKRAGKYFLFRCKDIQSNGLLKGFHFPDTEFDEDIDAVLTTRQTNEVKRNPKYRFLSSSSVFDFFNEDNPYYEVHYRVVRFQLDNGNYVSIITNLPRDEFSVEEIKELYHLRWGIEISFRHLKYSADLSAVHAKKRNSIQQEIWARMILYNLSCIIINHIASHKKKKRTKHEYVINKTRAIHLIRDILLKRKGGRPPNLEDLILQELLPLRPGRADPRNIKPHSVVSFNYRFS